VQHGEHDVHPSEHLTGPTRLEDHEPAARGVPGQRDRRRRRVDGRQLTTLDRELRGVVRAQHPRTVPGDPDRDDVEPLAVEVAQHAPGGDAGDGVLAAAAAEHHRHTEPRSRRCRHVDEE
jgi:hypothetical protein